MKQILKLVELEPAHQEQGLSAGFKIAVAQFGGQICQAVAQPGARRLNKQLIYQESLTKAFVLFNKLGTVEGHSSTSSY